MNLKERNGIMKTGFRKPNLKKSIKARTTGKLKREIKSAINPSYGSKGMGLINNPKKAVYNKIYSKTTVGISDFKSLSNSKKLDIIELNINDTYDDPLYEKAVKFALENGEVTILLLQKKFEIGYNRAAELFDMLKKREII